MESDKKCGGIEDPQPADAEMQTICDSVKRDVEKERGEKYETFRALSYKQQLVVGTNYFIEVFIGGDRYLEVDVFMVLPQVAMSRLTVKGVREIKKERV